MLILKTQWQKNIISTVESRSYKYHTHTNKHTHKHISSFTVSRDQNNKLKCINFIHRIWYMYLISPRTFICTVQKNNLILDVKFVFFSKHFYYFATSPSPALGWCYWSQKKWQPIEVTVQYTLALRWELWRSFVVICNGPTFDM